MIPFQRYNLNLYVLKQSFLLKIAGWISVGSVCDKCIAEAMDEEQNEADGRLAAILYRLLILEITLTLFPSIKICRLAKLLLRL